MKKITKIILAAALACGVSFAADAKTLFNNGKCAIPMSGMDDCSSLKGCSPKIKTSSSGDFNLATVTLQKNMDGGVISGTLKYIETQDAATGENVLGLYSSEMSCKGEDCATLRMTLAMMLGGTNIQYDVPYTIAKDEAAAIIAGGDEASQGWILVKAMQGDKSAVNELMIMGALAGMFDGLCSDSKE